MADFQLLGEQDIPEDSMSVDIAADSSVPEGGALQSLMAERQTDAEPSEERGGFFGLFSRETPAETEAELAPTPASAPEPAATPRGGLFGFGGGRSAATDAITAEVTPGTRLPYGTVARVCGMNVREMGKKIAQYPERRPIHKIYDSDPGNTAPHSFYVTGFDDGCARQFTASVAMFGSVVMHEKLRYGLPSEVQPYSDTDKAYEKLKSRLCGVPRGKPCGARVSRLEGSTVFVSIYERFGSNASWKNLLLHDGAVVAVDKKGG